jgi:hypothetical protein
MRKLNFILEYKQYIENISNLDMGDDIKIYTEFKSQNIVEGLIKTQPSSLSLKILLKRFPELNGNVEEDGEIYLEGRFKTLDNYIPLINNLGYFISKITLNGDEWITDFNNNSQPIVLFLEPKYDIKIIPLPKVLYHATLNKNVKRILQYGLIPKSYNKLSKHPDRIYFSDNYELVLKFGNYLKSENINEKIVILEINIDELNINLYKDLNLSENGFYTMDNISPKNITVKLIF